MVNLTYLCVSILLLIKRPQTANASNTDLRPNLELYERHNFSPRMISFYLSKFGSYRGPNICGDRCCKGWGRLATGFCFKPICVPSCGYHGTCIKPGKCTCRPGYHGKICQKKTKAVRKPRQAYRKYYTFSKPRFRFIPFDRHCVSITCYNGGSCVGGRCMCAPNFTGIRCQAYSRRRITATRRGEYSQRLCKSFCKAHGSCKRTIRGLYKCICETNYRGTFCTINSLLTSKAVNMSTAAPSYYATSLSPAGGALGNCYKPLNGVRCVVAFPELMSVMECCVSRGEAWGPSCTSCSFFLRLHNTRKKNCPRGFVFSRGTCKDIDECQDSSKCQNGICLNFIGSFKCSCNDGFQPSASSKTCLPQASATNNVNKCFIDITSDGKCVNEGVIQASKTACCCSFGKAWGMKCKLCPNPNSADHMSLCPNGGGYLIVPSNQSKHGITTISSVLPSTVSTGIELGKRVEITTEPTINLISPTTPPDKTDRAQYKRTLRPTLSPPLLRSSSASLNSPPNPKFSSSTFVPLNSQSTYHCTHTFSTPLQKANKITNTGFMPASTFFNVPKGPLLSDANERSILSILNEFRSRIQKPSRMPAKKLTATQQKVTTKRTIMTNTPSTTTTTLRTTATPKPTTTATPRPSTTTLRTTATPRLTTTTTLRTTATPRLTTTTTTTTTAASLRTTATPRHTTVATPRLTTTTLRASAALKPKTTTTPRTTATPRLTTKTTPRTTATLRPTTTTMLRTTAIPTISTARLNNISWKAATTAALKTTPFPRTSATNAQRKTAIPRLTLTKTTVLKIPFLTSPISLTPRSKTFVSPSRRTDQKRVKPTLLSTTTKPTSDNTNFLQNPKIYFVEQLTTTYQTSPTMQLSCDPSPCMNGGSCLESNLAEFVSCQCVSGFSGELCEKFDACFSNPCLNSGMCSVTNDHYKCSCPNGYSGQNCELVLDPCLSEPCVHGRCRNRFNRFACICFSGYTGSTCNQDINECEVGNVCLVSTNICKNTDGSYLCIDSITCGPGYQPSNDGGVCEDINECETNITRCGEGECVNTRGAFYCTCSKGYVVSLNGKHCQDLDECKTVDCGDAVCHNYPGTYKCECDANQVYEAASMSCKSRHDSENLASRQKLQSISLHGDRRSCYADKGSCSVKLISNITKEECCCTFGKAWNNCESCPKFGTQAFNILCPHGHGQFHNLVANKAHDIDECKLFGSSVACPNGKCINSQGAFQCICYRGFYYNHRIHACKDFDECSLPHKCVGGTCVNMIGSFHCQCSQNSVARFLGNGVKCIEHYITTTLPEIHQRGPCYTQHTESSICNETYERNATYKECCCSNGNYWGKFCSKCPSYKSDDFNYLCHPTELDVDIGHRDNNYIPEEKCGIEGGCENGVCVRVANGFTCKCNNGYRLNPSNMLCQDLNECLQHNAIHQLCIGGRCVNTIGSFICDCLNGYRRSKINPSFCIPVDVDYINDRPNS